MSQTDFGTLLGLRPNSVSDIETGKRAISRRVQMLIDAKFGRAEAESDILPVHSPDTPIHPLDTQVLDDDERTLINLYRQMKAMGCANVVFSFMTSMIHPDVSQAIPPPTFTPTSNPST